jgi:hypothetical protein
MLSNLRPEAGYLDKGLAILINVLMVFLSSSRQMLK